jgi:hypothetical protein
MQVFFIAIPAFARLKVCTETGFQRAIAERFWSVPAGAGSSARVFAGGVSWTWRPTGEVADAWGLLLVESSTAPADEGSSVAGDDP